MDTDARNATMQDGADLGVLDDLLDEVHEDALREQAEDLLPATAADANDEIDVLSPDDMLRQLDAVTLSDDDDDDNDFDHAAAFEDAHEEHHTLEALAGEDVPATSDTDESMAARVVCDDDDGSANAASLDELADFHDPHDESADDDIDSSSNDDAPVSASSGLETAALPDGAMPPADDVDEVAIHEPVGAAEVDAVTAESVVMLEDEETDSVEPLDNSASDDDESSTSPAPVATDGDSVVAAEAVATEFTARNEDDAQATVASDGNVNSSFEIENEDDGDSSSAVSKSSSQRLPHDPIANIVDSPSDDDVVEITQPDAPISSNDDNVDSDRSDDARHVENRVEIESVAQHRTHSDPDDATDAVADDLSPNAPSVLDNDVTTSDANSDGGKVDDKDMPDGSAHATSSVANDDGDAGDAVVPVASSEVAKFTLAASVDVTVDDALDAPAGVVPERATNEEVVDHSATATAHSNDGGSNSHNTEVTLTPPAPEANELDGSAVLPPPAPVALPVVIGSMVPTADDDDDDSDSQDETGSDQSAPPSPLRLGVDMTLDDDDDDDELEVDPAVVETIHVEKQQQPLSLQTAVANAPLSRNDKDDDSALLAALPLAHKFVGDSNAEAADAFDVTFTDEVRVAHMTVPPTTDAATPIAAAKRLERRSDDSVGSDAASAFGIRYTSLKSKHDNTAAAESDVTYALPAPPAFPDEREFETELTLSPDVAFSVKATRAADSFGTIASGGRDDDDDDDDEFSTSVVPLDSVEIDDQSVAALDARRASLQAREAADAARVIDELKRATDAEKAFNSATSAGPVGDMSTQESTSTCESESALSLRELHGMYKRGLGDQGVLLLEGDDGADASKPSVSEHDTTATSKGASRPLSVMGRILSKPSLISHVITEENGSDDDDDDGGGDDAVAAPHDSHRERELLIDTTATATRASSDNGSPGAADDWKEITLVAHSGSATPAASVTVSNNTSSQLGPKEAPSTTSFRIAYSEALAYCLEADVFLAHRDAIVAEAFTEPSRRSCFACFSPRPRLTFAGALDERDRVFCVAATRFDPLATDDVFTRVLQTLYAKLMRTTRAAPLTGAHWEDIGFQGNDPSTDLRGCGVLALLQMLYLVDCHPELALRFHSLSTHPTRHFPLACVLINVTLACITALRAGALYRECNKQASVFGAINTFYVALAAELMDELQSNADAVPIIIKSVLDDGRSHPDRVIDEFARADALGAHERPSQTAAASSTQRQSAAAAAASAPIEFTEIALQSTASEVDE